MLQLTLNTLDDCLKQSYCIVLFSPEWNYSGTVIKNYLETLDLPMFVLDTDEQIKLCRRYKVTILPSLILMKNGKRYKRFDGPLDEQQLEEIIADFKRHLKRCSLL